MVSKFKAYLALVSVFVGFTVLERLGLFDGWKVWLGIAASIPLALWAWSAVKRSDSLHAGNDDDIGRR